MTQPDHYAELGVLQTATVAEIRRAYRQLARRHHPDLNPGDQTAAARFRAITAAYEVLTDAAQRQDYDDRQRRPAAPPGGSGRADGSPAGPRTPRGSRAPSSGPARPAAPPAAAAPGPAGESRLERAARLERVRWQAAEAEVDLELLSKRYDEQRARADLWERRVALALRYGEADLAEQARLRQQSFRQLAAETQRRVQQAKVRAGLLRDVQRELETALRARPEP
jgi:curved DNA-binding protein CbpA